MSENAHDPDCGMLYEDGTEHCTCKLLPCPFCGNENPEMLGPDSVWCGSCLATMPEHDADAPNAIARWNTRLSGPSA
ncbi:Lar family restriction alleviation protein [Sphingomonas sp. T9W2]|uniref:Lar family restriction alleviation protein n=1 Tax=Sphingomonas sp. T9W2 TaxID=3143183 RepID=UPI0031F4E882